VIGSKVIKIIINNEKYELSAKSCLADAIAIRNPKPPFAVAVNLEFIPNTQYQSTLLKMDDRIEIISPITGG
jgi:sulfur carrier protein